MKLLQPRAVTDPEGVRGRYRLVGGLTGELLHDRRGIARPAPQGNIVALLDELGNVGLVSQYRGQSG